MMKNEPYDEKVDVWSFGMVLYELTTNTIPYQHIYNEKGQVTVLKLFDEIVTNKKTPIIPNDREIHPSLLELMKQCWNWNPQLRPSFSQIVQELDLRNSRKEGQTL
jgi:serine/threonine protein kinase